jgi:hypothetical protein
VSLVFLSLFARDFGDHHLKRLDMTESYHQSAKRVSAYNLRDGKFQIVGDGIKETRFGQARSLALRATVPEVVLTWIPKSTLVPN